MSVGIILRDSRGINASGCAGLTHRRHGRRRPAIHGFSETRKARRGWRPPGQARWHASPAMTAIDRPLTTGDSVIFRRTLRPACDTNRRTPCKRQHFRRLVEVGPAAAMTLRATRMRFGIRPCRRTRRRGRLRLCRRLRILRSYRADKRCCR
jgi:hypothetical protein